MRRHRCGVALVVVCLLACAGTALAVPSVDLQKTVYAGHDGGAGCPGAEEAVGVSGAPITYCFAIRNAGDTHLASISLVDGGLGITRADTTLLSGSEPLAPGATLTLFYQDAIVIDLVNTASTTANPVDAAGTDLPGLQNVTDNDTARVNMIAPAAVLEKTVYAGHNGGVGCTGDELVTGPVGSAITYCFLVRNVGDTHLGSIAIDDPSLGVTQAQMTRLLGNEPLTTSGVGSQILFYYQTTISADVVNTATVTANPVTSLGGDLADVPDVTAADTASVDELTPPTTTFTTTTSTSTTTTTIQVCECTDNIPFIARNSAGLAAGTFVNASLGVNSPVGLLRIAADAFLADGTTVSASRMKIADRASVYNVATNLLFSAPTTVIRGTTGPVTLPLLEPFCSLPPLGCGSGNLEVSGDESDVTLNAGDYGEVRVGAGGTLRLVDDGLYRFCELTLLDGATLLSNHQVTIDVLRGVIVGTGGSIRTVSGAPLVMNVGGAKLRIGKGARVDAAIVAPAARAKMKQSGTLNGCLCAALIKTAPNADLICVGD
jgi:hypothetical protein